MGKADQHLKAILEKARKSTARKQHLVPKFYLRNWADDRDLIRVTDTLEAVDYLKKPGKVGFITDFYTVESEEIDPRQLPPLLVETIYAESESHAAPIIRQLIGEGPDELDEEEVVAITMFLAFQMTRGRATRNVHDEMATNLFKLQFGALTDEGLRAFLGDEGEEVSEEDVAEAREAIDDLMAGTITVGPHQASSISMAMSSALDVAALLASRVWMVCTSPTPIITCDEPVVFLGSEDRPRGERGGLIDAWTIAFPLSSRHALMMLAPPLGRSDHVPLVRAGRIYRDRLDLVEALQLCRELAMNCQRWIFEHPQTRIGSNMWIPPSSSLASFEWIDVVDADGVEGQIQRSFPTTRWSQVPRSLWPRGRWWPDTLPPEYPRRRRYRYRGSFSEVDGEGKVPYRPDS